MSLGRALARWLEYQANLEKAKECAVENGNQRWRCYTVNSRQIATNANTRCKKHLRNNTTIWSIKEKYSDRS